jgi:hypothetical protein
MSRFDEGCGAAIRRPRRRDVVKYGIAAASAPAMAAAAVGSNVPGVAYESRAAGDPLPPTRAASPASSFPTVATWLRPTPLRVAGKSPYAHRPNDLAIGSPARICSAVRIELLSRVAEWRLHAGY